MSKYYFYFCSSTNSRTCVVTVQIRPPGAAFISPNFSRFFGGIQSFWRSVGVDSYNRVSVPVCLLAGGACKKECQMCVVNGATVSSHS